MFIGEWYILLNRPVQVSEPNHYFHHCYKRTNQVMFNNVDSTIVVKNTNDKERTVLPGYYSIGKIIAMFNTITDTTF